MKITIEVPNRRIMDAIESFHDGGRGLWCRRVDRLGATIVNGGVLDYTDDHTGKVHRVSATELERALILMSEHYQGHAKDLAAGTGDMETGNVLVQLMVFGELVYG